MKSPVEFIPSSDLNRVRRNFLFANSLLFIAAVTQKNETMKVAVISSDAFPVPLALAFLAVASGLFLYEYMYQYRISHMRNTDATAGKDEAEQTKTFDTSLTRTFNRLGAMKEEIAAAVTSLSDLAAGITNQKQWLNPSPLPTELSEQFEQFQTMSERLVQSIGEELNFHHETADGELQNALMHKWRMLRDATEFYLEDVRKTKSTIDQEFREVSDTLSESGTVAAQLKEISQRIENYEASLTRISQSVHGFQERDFFWNDLILPLAYFASACGLSIWRSWGVLGAPIWEIWAAGGAVPLFLLVCAKIYRRNPARYLRWYKRMQRFP